MVKTAALSVMMLSNVTFGVHSQAVDPLYVNEAGFYALSSGGLSSTRYATSQLGDTSESIFRLNQQVNQQLAARGTEFRSMNKFTAAKPSFENQPAGAAGPDEKEKTIQGWIRVYGAKGSADSKGDFSSYDSGTWGTVIGIDKSFKNILIGLAGGYAGSDIDGVYHADIDAYHGSLYSTYDGEQVFVDLALTYGQSDTKETIEGSDSSSYDADFMSLYVGTGMTFEFKETVAITPEASLLATYYKQDDFTRSGPWGSAVADTYDTSSYLTSLGVNLSTIHQLDWLSSGLAFLPELRLHWLHELNADQDDFQYNVNGAGFLPFAVRSRDENMGRFGIGFDMWSWKHQHIKLELDYDALLSDSYKEQIISGKITVKF